MRLSPPGTHLTAESTEAMRMKCLAQGNNILLPGFEPSTSVSKTDILANRPIWFRVDSELSVELEVKVGMHQGSVLSPFFFAMVVDAVT